ncbi:hypothetical protein SVIOM342S_05139 [Streptomyces violaceorubidus]
MRSRTARTSAPSSIARLRLTTRPASTSNSCGTNSAFVTFQRSPARPGGAKVKRPMADWLPRGSRTPSSLTISPAIWSPMP